MAFLRVSRAVPALFRAARPTVVRPQLYRQIARRTYASGGHESAKSSGDAVWAATSVAVTAPILYYLIQNAPDTSHGHDDHGDAHGKEHEEVHEEEESKDEGSEEKSDDNSNDGEDKAEDKDSEKSGDEESGDEDKGAETPDTSDDEGEGETKESSDAKNTRKSIPDAKGGSKARFESNKGIKQGETANPDASEDEAAASKPAGSQNTQSGKQEGLSNTDTKHSTDITNNPEKSRKGEGSPETAKLKGPVDPKRPQPENK